VIEEPSNKENATVADGFLSLSIAID